MIGKLERPPITPEEQKRLVDARAAKASLLNLDLAANETEDSDFNADEMEEEVEEEFISGEESVEQMETSDDEIIHAKQCTHQDEEISCSSAQEEEFSIHSDSSDATVRAHIERAIQANELDAMYLKNLASTLRLAPKPAGKALDHVYTFTSSPPLFELTHFSTHHLYNQDQIPAAIAATSVPSVQTIPLGPLPHPLPACLASHLTKDQISSYSKPLDVTDYQESESVVPQIELHYDFELTSAIDCNVFSQGTPLR